MNREDIFYMAQEAELINKDYDFAFLNKFTDKVERFAALVASAERKECEKIIWNADSWIGSDAKIWIVKSIQEARGQA